MKYKKGHTNKMRPLPYFIFAVSHKLAPPGDLSLSHLQ